ncbi:ATPase [Anaeromassilibacillus sp. An200]|nr:ATPase [Anaeromassilibacillus sp. An200]
MNEKMNVEELLDELYDMVEKAWNFPLSRGRAMLDVEEVKEILEEIRDAMPQEIRQAKAIVADRTQIISDAKREAETIVRVAEERARAMVNQDEIVKQAQQKANEMLAQAQTRFRKMQKACNVYIDDLMQRTDEGLTANLAELRKTRQEIKASLRSGQQNQN